MLGGARKQSSRDFSGIGAASKAANFITELHLESNLGAAASIRAGQGAASLRRELVPGKDAQVQRPRFVPGKERGGEGDEKILA